MRKAASYLALLLALLALLAAPALAAPSVFLEELTTTEVSALLKAGHTTIIIPVGGTEQSGPHLLLGKHNERVHLLAGRIARALGNALVAPVLAYVPEGNISPPSGHMAFAGTISIPEPVFRQTLEAAGRSFRQHGFRDIVLLGDHGGYQQSLEVVAKALNREWAASGARAYFAAEYYGATQKPYEAQLAAHGLTPAQIGVHAGSADTSLQLALDPASVRRDKLEQAAREGRSGGTRGDPRAASAALGQLGVDAVVEQTVAGIRAAVSAHH